MPDAGIRFVRVASDNESRSMDSERSRYVALDAKFADGKRFLRFLDRWLARKTCDSTLHYIAYSEDYVCRVDLDQGGSEVRSCIHELRAQWPPALPGLHRLKLGAGRVVLTLCFGQAKFYLPRLRARVDWIFSEVDLEKQSDEGAWLSLAFARMAASGARLNLWITPNNTDRLCVNAFLKTIEARGFLGRVIKIGTQNTVEWRGKFAASKQPVSELREVSIKPKHRARLKRAVILGAGLAGTSVAVAIARRGWEVLVIDQREGVAQGASGNLSAVISPMLSKDDSFASRLSRASFLQLLREIAELNRSSPSVRWEPCGVIQLASDEHQEEAFLDLLRIHQYPSDYVRYIDAEEVVKISGAASATRGALFFPGAGWVNPPSLCETRLAVDGVRVLFGQQVFQLAQQENQWQVFSRESGLIAEASVVVIANGFEATNFKQSQYLRLKKVRGQVTHLRCENLMDKRTVICGDGYLTPGINGVCSLGATYDFGVDDGSVIESSTIQNLNRFPKLMPGRSVPDLSFVVGGRVGFRSLSADRLPIIGQLVDAYPIESRANHWERLSDIPRLAGLFTCLGMGSRGAVWSGMAGEILASLIEGEPSPIEGDLLDAIDPAREVLRQGRRVISS